MPYHLISYTQRTVTHKLAENEVVAGKCGTVLSDKIKNDSDIGYDWSYDEKSRIITGYLKNYGTKFCFGDKDFGVGCVVDRTVC